LHSGLTQSGVGRQSEQVADPTYARPREVRGKQCEVEQEAWEGAKRALLPL